MRVYAVVDYKLDETCDVVAVFTDQETARLYAKKAGDYDVETCEIDPPVTDEWLNSETWWEAQVVEFKNGTRTTWYRPAHAILEGVDFSVKCGHGLGALVTFSAGHPDTVSARAAEIYQDWKKIVEEEDYDSINHFIR